MLHDSIQIKTMTLKNRLVMPPMATYKADADGKVTQPLCDYYAEKSRGGHIGLVIVEHSYVSPEGKAGPNQLSVSSDSDLDGLGEQVRTLHRNGTPVMAQINHAGAAARPDIPGIRPLSAGSEPAPRRKGEPPAAMTPEDIRKTVSDFAAAAERVKTAGFDGVEIHSAHGYLLNQFLSPLTNQRSDAYGAQRTRLHLEIIAAVRAAVGPDYPVALRLGACDYMPGGITLEESIPAAEAFEQAGIDLLDISGGFCGYRHPESSEPGYFSELTRPIREHVHIPVILTGGITDPEAAEHLLKGGSADLIGVGRAILNDSSWAMRAMN